MKKIACLTCKELDQYSCIDDQLFIDLLNDKDNIEVSSIPWDEETDWSVFDLIIIRTTWDYMQRPKEFIKALEHMSSVSRLINPIETIKWNYNKKYLLEIEKNGEKIIPTLLEAEVNKENISQIFERINQGEGIIIKPTIGASSQGIQLLKTPDELSDTGPGEWLVQPFQKSIQEHGEFSLFIFGGNFSHAVNKLPKAGEFRSQEEFDSRITNYIPSDEIKNFATNAIKNLDYKTEYARVDIILDQDNNPQIIELELIEPCLFLKYDPNAAKNFANHILKVLG